MINFEATLVDRIVVRERRSRANFLLGGNKRNIFFQKLSHSWEDWLDNQKLVMSTHSMEDFSSFFDSKRSAEKIYVLSQISEFDRTEFMPSDVLRLFSIVLFPTIALMSPPDAVNYYVAFIAEMQNRREFFFYASRRN